jgi:Domain of unknown function (DUF3846)
MRCLIFTEREPVHFDERVTLNAIKNMIRAEIVDSVLLADGVHVMIVDDNGHEKGLPLNPQATALYWERCGGRNDHFIVGDVVVVPDSDFAP